MHVWRIINVTLKATYRKAAQRDSDTSKTCFFTM